MRILKLIDNSYGFKEIKFDSKSLKYKDHLKRLRNINEGTANSKIPRHTHSPKTCAKNGCKFMERDFKRSIHNTGANISDDEVIQR